MTQEDISSYILHSNNIVTTCSNVPQIHGKPRRKCVQTATAHTSALQGSAPKATTCLQFSFIKLTSQDNDPFPKIITGYIFLK